MVNTRLVGTRLAQHVQKIMSALRSKTLLHVQSISTHKKEMAIVNHVLMEMIAAISKIPLIQLVVVLVSMQDQSISCACLAPEDIIAELVLLNQQSVLVAHMLTKNKKPARLAHLSTIQSLVVLTVLQCHLASK